MPRQLYTYQGSSQTKARAEAETEKAHGFIAEEVEAVNKDFCFYNKDKDGKDVLAGVYYKTLISPLIKLVQDQKKEINFVYSQGLKNGVDDLEFIDNPKDIPELEELDIDFAIQRAILGDSLASILLLNITIG